MHPRFDLPAALAILERTPATLTTWLDGLPEAWVSAVEQPGAWSAYDVVGHLIHGERTDWIRARAISCAATRARSSASIARRSSATAPARHCTTCCSPSASSGAPTSPSSAR